MNFDEEMTFDEVVRKFGGYMALDTLEGYINALDILGWARGKFTEPAQRDKIENFHSEVMFYSHSLAAREYPHLLDDNDFEDDDDLDDEGDDPTVTIRVGAGKDGKIEYISG
jgi:hypothetical protein